MLLLFPTFMNTCTLSGVKSTSLGVSIKTTMKRLRKLATHFHHSSQATAAIKTLCEALEVPWCKPVQDVVTRWWSTYLLLASMLHLERAVKAYEPNLPADLRLTAVDWLICRRAAELLEPFMEVQKMLEGDQYVTGSLCIPMLHDLRMNLEAASADDEEEPLPTAADERAADATLREVAKAMKKTFNEKFGDGSGIVMYTEVNRRSVFLPTFPFLAVLCLCYLVLRVFHRMC